MASRRTRRARGIVLDRTKLGEQDLILTLLIQSGERVSVVARGARKPGGRLAARCELFSETDFLLARGRGLEVVAEASLVESHSGIRGDLARVSAASAVCEVASLTSFDDAPDPFLYPLCSRVLRACEEARDQQGLDVAVAAYVFKVLAHGGWFAQLGSCVLCGDQSRSYFSARSGGALCSSCAKDVPDAIEMGPSELKWIDAFIRSTFDELVLASIDMGMSTKLLGVAHTWAATHLDARLRSMEFMLSL